MTMIRNGRTAEMELDGRALILEAIDRDPAKVADLVAAMITVDLMEMMMEMMQRFPLTATLMAMQRLMVDLSWQLMLMVMAVDIATMQIAGWIRPVTRMSELVPNREPRKQTLDRNQGPNRDQSLAVPGGAVRDPSLDPEAMTDLAQNRVRNLDQAPSLEDLVTTPMETTLL